MFSLTFLNTYSLTLILFYSTSMSCFSAFHLSCNNFSVSILVLLHFFSCLVFPIIFNTPTHSDLFCFTSFSCSNAFHLSCNNFSLFLYLFSFTFVPWCPVLSLSTLPRTLILFYSSFLFCFNTPRLSSTNSSPSLYQFCFSSLLSRLSPPFPHSLVALPQFVFLHLPYCLSLSSLLCLTFPTPDPSSILPPLLYLANLVNLL